MRCRDSDLRFKSEAVRNFDRAEHVRQFHARAGPYRTNLAFANTGWKLAIIQRTMGIVVTRLHTVEHAERTHQNIGAIQLDARCERSDLAGERSRDADQSPLWIGA